MNMITSDNWLIMMNMRSDIHCLKRSLFCLMNMITSDNWLIMMNMRSDIHCLKRSLDWFYLNSVFEENSLPFTQNVVSSNRARLFSVPSA